MPADFHTSTSQPSISYPPALMPPHSLGSVDWNTTKPTSSLAFLPLSVTPRAALQSQLYSFLRLLVRALAEGTYAEGCFWFRRVPQLSRRKQRGNLNRRIHPRSGNLLSTGLMVLAPTDCKPLPPALHGDWQDQGKQELPFDANQAASTVAGPQARSNLVRNSGGL